MSLEIVLVPCYTDNYAVLLHDKKSGQTACIDAPEARPILSALAERGWKLNLLLITHHHNDHIAGNKQLKDITGTKIYGPKAEQKMIPDMDQLLTGEDKIEFAGHPITIIETPGHTKGHICYHFTDDKLLFTGDTLFALGCGRLFEDTPAKMWESLSKLNALPKSTQIYCGHEYTLSNAEFALKQEPDNIDLQTRIIEIRQARARNQPTLPTTLELEQQTNPFLRPNSKEIRKNLGMETATDEEVFTKLRQLKDQG